MEKTEVTFFRKSFPVLPLSPENIVISPHLPLSVEKVVLPSCLKFSSLIIPLFHTLTSSSQGALGSGFINTLVIPSDIKIFL